MKPSFVIVFSFFIAFGCSTPETPTTFILVRHAEKGNDGTEDPDLKTEGVERAARLNQLLRDTEIDAIYSTNFKRTRQTVAPLANVKNRQIQTYESFKDDEIQAMLEEHNGGTLVLCGHSNNIPWTANLLIGREEFNDYQDTEYGILLIVSVVEKGKSAKVTRLNY